MVQLSGYLLRLGFLSKVILKKIYIKKKKKAYLKESKYSAVPGLQVPALAVYGNISGNIGWLVEVKCGRGRCRVEGKVGGVSALCKNSHAGLD